MRAVAEERKDVEDMTETTTRRRDRAEGTLLGSAVGDALGAGYEYGCAPLGPDGPAMIGGGLGDFAPGVWTDDTTMTWCVADVVARGPDLLSADGLTAVARNFRAWYETDPPDIGVQTRYALRSGGPEPTGAGLTEAARRMAAGGARTAGNGSLMRTAPVALAYLHDTAACAAAARAVSGLTHADPLAGDACVLWTAAIRHAVVDERLDVRVGLGLLDGPARDRWTAWIDEAETRAPFAFTGNGFVVKALQAAWSAIYHAGAGRSGTEHLRAALELVIEVGDDTDTTAAIAGALLGARWGASAVPREWREVCHGYPGITVEELVALAP